MDYVEITVSTSSLGADAVSDEMLRLGAMGTQILDRADLPDPEKPVHNWELMDQSVIDNMPEDVQVKAWYGEEETPVILEKLRSFLPTLRESCHFDLGTLEISVQSVQDTDWNENWKKYYKPFRAGKHLVIKPSWETWDAQEGDLIIEMDPGMAFGTGTHETTALCVELIEDYYKGGTLLDVGTGSGILALCAAKLGAENITAVDIDPDAVRVAKENAQRNGIENTEFFCADAGKAALELEKQGIKADVVVVDPPRKGLNADAIEALARIAPRRIVYVSCDPATLARDVALLKERGYTLAKIQTADLFPRCAHIESIACLIRE